MKINVLLPYEGAEGLYERWAHDEDSIDFLKDFYEAGRCTVSYAAQELCTYLKKLGHEASVCKEKGDFNIFLSAKEGESEEFEIKREGNDIYLNGQGRAGALFSVYELLEIQGIRWYSPVLEYVPEEGADFVFPQSKHYKYDLPDARGFHFECILKETTKFLVWMVRNRMRVYSSNAHSRKLQQKLCMITAVGGHMFEKILDPLNVEVNGKYYIDTHKDWYGVPADELTVENALKTQFCVTNEELLDRLADTIIERARSEWKHEDLFHISGFDTWGKSCNCEKCVALGNGSDRALHYLSHFRKRLDEAYESGKINRKIIMSIPVYEGTDTMKAPLNPVPQNLIDAGDVASFAPILRCYKHDIYDTSCDRNRPYKAYYEAWEKTGMKLMVNEYYNVSKFEDLPYVFTTRIYNDVRYYKEHNLDRMMYMHVPVVEWGVRATTQYLLANIMRDSDCDYYGLLDKYFCDVFGEYADEAKEAYEKLEEATLYCTSWRGWFETSILTNLCEWDGKIPEKSLYRDSDIGENAVEIGYEATKLIREALDIMRDIREREIEKLSKTGLQVATAAMNPIEQQKMKSQTVLIDKLCEDIRGIIYGLDAQELITLMLDYHETLLAGNKERARELLDKIKPLGARLSEYTVGYSPLAYQPDFELRDGLRRTQLKELYYRCLANKSI